MLSRRDKHEHYESLLEPIDDEASVVTKPSSCSCILARNHWRWIIICHVVLLLAYISASVCLYTRWAQLKDTSSSDDLGFPHIYQAFEVDPKLNESIAWGYTGPPSERLDQNWDDLLHNANIAVQEQKMLALGRLDQGVKLGDGSGYLGQLAVYHSLHCVKRIHHFLHREYYFADLSEQEIYMLGMHNVHCLDLIRQSLMCQGDTSLITMRWGDMQPVPVANNESPHQCVSWEALDGWAHERRVNVNVPGMVVHPSLGPAYAGENKHLGVVIDHDHH